MSAQRRAWFGVQLMALVVGIGRVVLGEELVENSRQGRSLRTRPFRRAGWTGAEWSRGLLHALAVTNRQRAGRGAAQGVAERVRRNAVGGQQHQLELAISELGDGASARGAAALVLADLPQLLSEARRGAGTVPAQRTSPTRA
jgi:hypothetical protein